MAMSAEHKAALAQGRKEARAIKAYLQALRSRRPGRPVTTESVHKKIEALMQKIQSEADPLRELELRQQKLDAEEALQAADAKADLPSLEAEFVKYARPYSERKGISYTAWRESGVLAAALKKAGIPRTRRS